MKKEAVLSILVFLFLWIIVFPADVLSQSEYLKEGIEQYKQENFEEAVEILIKAREQQPDSSTAAYFLGLAYKQIINYPKAVENLRDAVTLTPRIKDALVELIDVLNRMGGPENLAEAHTWIAVAEEEGIAPAKTAFLKGLVLQKEGKNLEAVKSFEKAVTLDDSLTQSAEVQMAMCYVKERDLKMARERFSAAITYDPQSDLATFARQYQDMVEERLYLERPLRLTIGIFGGYDTNIVSKPIDPSVAGDITDEEGSVLSSSVRLDYVPKLEGPYLFNAQYAAVSNVNSEHTHSHDSLANSFSISPGYNFGRFSLNLNANYTNVLLRTDPDIMPTPDSNPGYKRYLDYTSIGPTLRVLFNQNNIFELFAGYDRKEYFNQKTTSPDDDRDSVGLRTYLSWIWLFRENSFLNLRYDFTNENADGRQWTNDGNRLTVSVSFPVISEEKSKRIGPVTMQLTGSAFFQDYSYECDYGVVTRSRQDEIYTGSAGLAWRCWKHASLIAQYTRTENKSNVPIYEYDRDQYSAGLEFRF